MPSSTLPSDGGAETREPASHRTLMLDRSDAVALARFAAASLVLLLVLEGVLRVAAPRIRHFDIVEFPFEQGKKRFRLAELVRAGAQPDVLFAGDSTIETGVSPRDYSSATPGQPTAFNYASGANNAEFARHVVNDALENLGAKPRLLVFGWSYVVFGGKDPAAPGAHEKHLALAGMRRISGHAAAGDALRLWTDRDVARSMVEHGPPWTTSPEELVEHDGWVRFPKPFGDHPKADRDAFGKLVSDALAVYEVTPEIRANAEATFDMLAAAGIPVVFILTPVSPEMREYDPRIDGVLATVRREILPLARARGLRVIDASATGEFHPRQFMDLMHLNQEGAVAFSRWLAAQPEMIQPPPSTRSPSS